MRQPKPNSKKYTDLICEIENGSIKIPKFQRDFVWEIAKTANLLDSIIKGYPIGTFILWETTERMSAIKDIGNQNLQEPKENYPIQYVLDGQQRMTSLYVARKGLCLGKGKNYENIYVNLDCNNSDDEPIVTENKPEGNHIKICELLVSSVFSIIKKYDNDEVQKTIENYRNAFQTYEFSTIELKDEKIETAIEVFTRINTSGKVLTLFEIMVAKTYDENKKFDMLEKWDNFKKDVENYGTINNSVILHLLRLSESLCK